MDPERPENDDLKNEDQAEITTEDTEKENVPEETVTSETSCPEQTDPEGKNVEDVPDGDCKAGEKDEKEETDAPVKEDSESEDEAEDEDEEDDEDEEADEQKPRNTLVSDIIRVIVIAIFVVALGALSHIGYEYLHGVELSARIKGAVIDDKPVAAMERPDRATPPYPGVMTPVVTYPDIITKEKLQFLKSENSDFRLWFYIDGTDISYPVMFSGDNDFYLHRDFYKESNISGTLFLDFRNRKIGGNTIIYGHNMKNGSMFGSLKEYADEVFFRLHTMIYTYSEDEIIAWEIFSAYPTDIYNNYIRTSFSGEDEYLEFIRSLQNDSIYSTDVELTAKDDILTLSTCRTGEGNRFVVHAKKVYTFPME